MPVKIIPGKRILVYGQLRAGGRTHKLIKDCLCLGEAYTQPRFTLIDLGGHTPIAIPRGNNSIIGEVYSVPDEVYKQILYTANYPRLCTTTHVSTRFGPCIMLVLSPRMYVLAAKALKTAGYYKDGVYNPVDPGATLISKKEITCPI